MLKGIPVRRIWFLALLLVSCLAVAAFHRRAAAPELRYSCVAEGNISQSVYSILNRGVSGIVDTVRGDAYWGRVRPVHSLYHSAPFLMTMVRNGDLWRSAPGSPLPERMNGDLQTHTLVQMFAISLAVSAMAWLTWRATRLWWSAFLLPMVFVVANGSLGENLLVNYCDSGEIGQLLFISLYLASIVRPLAGRPPKPAMEITGAALLALAYFMKETTIVILPMVLGVLIIRLVPAFRPSPAYKRYVARHALVHLALAGTLLLAVYLVRSGPYVAQNYQVKTDFLVSASRSWRLMALPSAIVVSSIVGLIAGVVALFIERRRTGVLPRAAVDAAGVLFLCGTLTAGFWAVNLPWSAALRKYYLPAFFFAAAFSVTTLALVTASLLRQRLQPPAWLWAIGSIACVLGNAPASRAEIDRWYQIRYEHRKTVPVIAADIAASVRPGTPPPRIRLVAGHMFPEGALPFCRVANRFHRLNIARKGDVVSTVKAAERNYFRRYPETAAVEIKLSESLSSSLDADRVYVFAGAVPNEEAALAARGYRFSKRLDVGTPATRIALYTKP